MKKHFVYMLKCADKSYYVGLTADLEQRIAEHNNRQASYYTATRVPVEVVFVQDFTSKDDAIILERKLKGWTRSKKEALINSNWNLLQILSKKKFIK